MPMETIRGNSSIFSLSSYSILILNQETDFGQIDIKQEVLKIDDFGRKRKN
jgi:hypothetical protein